MNGIYEKKTPHEILMKFKEVNNLIGITASNESIISSADDKFKIKHFKRHNEPYIDGKKVYKRIFIRKK